MATEEYTQEEINKGQRHINYELCRVDTKILEALKAFVTALQDVKIPPSKPGGPHEIDLTEVNAKISKAEEINKKVADIRPPGCESPYPN